MRMILVESCEECPHFHDGYCAENAKRYTIWNQIPQDCPLNEAPGFGVSITDEAYRPEDGTNLDAITDALSFSAIPAWVQEVKP